MVKLKQNLSNFKPRSLRPSRRQLVKIAIFVVVLIGVGGLGWFVYDTKFQAPKVAVNCAESSQSAKKLLGQADQDNKQAAYQQLKPVADKCATVQNEEVKKPDKVQEYVDLMKFNGDLAVAAYVAGDQNQAKAYAEQGIKLNESRTNDQSIKIPRDQIPALNRALSDMYDIRDGIYQHSPAKFTDDGAGQ